MKRCGLCVATALTAQLVLSATAAAQLTATVSGDTTICVGDSATLTVTVTGGLAPYSITLSNGDTQSGDSPLSFTVSPNTTTTYTASGTDSNGRDVAAGGGATVTVSEPPTPASVGGDQTICAGATTAVLGGNSPDSGTGGWSLVGGGTGTFSDASDPNATFTHTGGTGPIVLRWTVASPPCPESAADVTITIVEPPTTASAGPDQTICVSNGTTAGLGGNTPAVGTGSWSVLSGGTGVFNPNASDPNATFTHTSGTGPIMLRWTIANPPCADSTADVAITIVQLAITCPADVTVSTDPGACLATNVDIGTATTSDDCPDVVVSNDHPSGTYPKGTTTVTWTATDAAGNAVTCTQTVTVNDTESPAITCPADLTVATDTGSCEATNVDIGTATATDNCPDVTVSNDHPSGTYPKGMTTVTWTAIDAAGNSAACTQTVTVNDTESPVITCPADVTVSTDPGSSEATDVDIGTATAADNCPDVTVGNDHASTTYPKGTTTVTWTAIDAAGNTATCTQTVTVASSARLPLCGLFCGFGVIQSVVASLVGLTLIRFGRRR
jgi:hypothetical protein